MNYKEQRAHPRYPIPTLVDLEFEDGTYRHEFTVNIGHGGMYVETDRTIESGLKVNLRFLLPNLNWVFEVQGRIVWTSIATQKEKLDGKKDSFGIAFISMDEIDAEKLAIYLQNFKLEDLEL